MILDDQKLPPAPILLMLSTDGVLIPFYMITKGPITLKELVEPVELVLDGERVTSPQPPPQAASFPSAPLAPALTDNTKSTITTNAPLNVPQSVAPLQPSSLFTKPLVPAGPSLQPPSSAPMLTKPALSLSTSDSSLTPAVKEHTSQGKTVSGIPNVPALPSQVCFTIDAMD